MDVYMQYVAVIKMVQSSRGNNIEHDLEVYMQYVFVTTMV